MKNHNFLQLNKLITAILIFTVTACSTYVSPTYGPIQENNFQDVFLQNIQITNQEVLFYSRAIWYPDKNGFKFFPASKKSSKGVIVYTDQAIYFSEWGASQYRTKFSINYHEIKQTRLAGNELFGRVVIQTDNYNSFEILGTKGIDLPQKEETEIAYNLIEQQRNL